MTDLAGLLACPRCNTPLEALHCSACQVEFPAPGGVPWLFADPGAAISEWKNRWQLAREQLRADLARVRAALPGASRDPTRQRLTALAAGYQAQEKHLQQILAPLGAASGTSRETLLAMRTRVPPAQGITSYDANVFRDWCWGDAENAASRDAVLSGLGNHSPSRVLVLGAGAGRLAYDLHQHSPAALTVAVDLNPLLVWVGHTVAQGETTSLVEFPLAPRTPGQVALERTLSAPSPARPGFVFCLADVMRPPFVPGSFDVVVTPWLLDVMGEPAADVLQRVNGLLADDGVWVYHGSVAFDAPDPAERLTAEELQGVAEEQGFTDLEISEQTLPYLDCPDSRHGRREHVATLRGRKHQPAGLPARHQALPDWITLGRTPIPALPAFQTQAMTTRVHAFIMSLIDGHRSLKDMARVLEEQKLMPRQEAEAALRGFLTTMHDEAARAGRP